MAGIYLVLPQVILLLALSHTTSPFDSLIPGLVYTLRLYTRVPTLVPTQHQ